MVHGYQNERYGRGKSGSETLKAACIRIINRNAEKIKRTEKWKKFKAEYVDGDVLIKMEMNG